MYSHPFPATAGSSGSCDMSLDLLTEMAGYRFFSNGRSWHGQPLHDRQHPHILSELSISYSQKFTQDVSSYLYFDIRRTALVARVHASPQHDDIPMRPLAITAGLNSHHVRLPRAVAVAQRESEGPAFYGPRTGRRAYDLIGRASIPTAPHSGTRPPTSHSSFHGYIKGPEGLDRI